MHASVSHTHTGCRRALVTAAEHSCVLRETGAVNKWPPFPQALQSIQCVSRFTSVLSVLLLYNSNTRTSVPHKPPDRSIIYSWLMHLMMKMLSGVCLCKTHCHDAGVLLHVCGWTLNRRPPVRFMTQTTPHHFGLECVTRYAHLCGCHVFRSIQVKHF